MRRQGFSLVELSIVLVILGLLVGGILAGQSLIRAAELRKTSAAIENYRRAMHAFKDKYFAIPGDMPNATAFWGSITASGATCPWQAGTGTQTCDGNGNGVFDNPESWRFWQHLSNAGMIEGSYIGRQGSGSPNWDVPGWNIPVLNTHANIGVSYFNGTTHTYDYSLVRGVYFILGRCCDGGGMSNMPAYRPEDAWNIDKKLDDGAPDRGTIQIHKGYNSGCVTVATSPNDYSLTNTGLNCTLYATSGL